MRRSSRAASGRPDAPRWKGLPRRFMPSTLGADPRNVRGSRRVPVHEMPERALVVGVEPLRSRRQVPGAVPWSG
ncbi:hypothetical protein GCM10009751_17210 [Myceligenerans crystallogenes]|uniref:Uncharacterized protein n=1 Tax=Myceligenerans crystallogenes TaxID=316335 RepID=A0ABN2NAB9_9MICO